MILTTAAVLSPSAESNELLPRVGYRNLFREGTVTVSSEHADHPKELAYDGLTYDGWQSLGNAIEFIAVQNAPAEAADYMAVLGQFAGCVLTPQHSADGIDWTDLEDPFMPADNAPIVWEFDEESLAHKRLLFTECTGPVVVSAIHVGRRLEMEVGLPVGWQPPSLNEDVVHANVMSEGGQILGRNIIRRGVRATVSSDPVSYAWARDEWRDFIESAQLQAFFFWWLFQGEVEIVYGGLASHGGNFRSVHEIAARFEMAGLNR